MERAVEANHTRQAKSPTRRLLSKSAPGTWVDPQLQLRLGVDLDLFCVILSCPVRRTQCIFSSSSIARIRTAIQQLLISKVQCGTRAPVWAEPGSVVTVVSEKQLTVFYDVADWRQWRHGWETALCFLAQHTNETRTPPTTQIASSKTRKEPKPNQRRKPKTRTKGIGHHTRC